MADFSVSALAGEGVTAKLKALHLKVISCERCERLVTFRRQVAAVKRREYANWEYWGRPVPGFGDPNAELFILGLAPAAHGGNRTGRVFTGDPSARFLMRALYEAGFANQPRSDHREDGLQLRRAYITAAVKCVPPGNRPTPGEFHNCYSFLSGELKLLLPKLKAVLALGQFAFQAYLAFLKREFGVNVRGLRFTHGASYDFGSRLPTLYASYHPSPRNTNTRKLTRPMFVKLLKRIKQRVNSQR